MVSDKSFGIIDILIILFTFGSVVLDSGDNLLKLIKVLFVIPCFVYVVKTLKLYFDLYVKWMLSFTIFAGLSFFWAISLANAAYRYQTLVLNFICIYCLLVYLKSCPTRINIILKTLCFAPLILETRVIVSYGLLAFANTRSLDGIMSPNSIGMRAAIAVVLGTFFLVKQGKHKALYLPSIFLNLAIVILSASRKAIFFMIVPLLLHYVLCQNNSLKFWRNFTIVLLLIGLTYYGIMNIPFVYDLVGYRIETMINGILGLGKTDGSTSLRLKMIKWGFKWFKRKPWFGYGLNNYKSLLGRMNTSYGREGVYAHNNYVEMLVNLGITGTAIYYFIYLKLFMKAVRARKRLNGLQQILVCIFGAIVLGEIGMVTYIELYVQIIIALTWAVLYLLAEKEVEGDGSYAVG